MRTISAQKDAPFEVVDMVNVQVPPTQTCTAGVPGADQALELSPHCHLLGE
jgi:hypothetical protein